ncbi:MAG: hypothetical protein JOZ68_15160 [Acidimicrobiia bacterium]|nr:hypothetical protein [Acidimicrobiia bacterium]MBV8985340.1 hypothetical protein [Acidimicrobiia bacterium]MBV9042343.1 hypothetical protein [Acidimicrobiia bacterium]
MARRVVRAALVVIITAVSLGFTTMTSPAAHAADTITLQLEFNRACYHVTGPPFAGWGCLGDSAVSLDGTFVGYPRYIPIAGCNGEWNLYIPGVSPDGLSGTMTFCGQTDPIEVSVTYGSGRFAGYTAPPTPQPGYVLRDIDPGVHVPSNPLCGDGYHPLGSCPDQGTKVGTGIVTLTLTKTG